MVDSETSRGNEFELIVSTTSFDNSISLQITSFRLNGRNFLYWSRSVQIVIRGKGRLLDFVRYHRFATEIKVYLLVEV